MAKGRRRLKPACPSCGQPIGSGFPLVKTVLAVLLFGYIFVSAILMRMSLPPEMRRRYRDMPFDAWMQPLSQQPVFQIIVMGGVLAGMLLLYWDWFQGIYENWKKKREASLGIPQKTYRYKCRSCGHEWN